MVAVVVGCTTSVFFFLAAVFVYCAYLHAWCHSIIRLESFCATLLTLAGGGGGGGGGFSRGVSARAWDPGWGDENFDLTD